MHDDEPLLPWPLHTRAAQLLAFGLAPALVLLAYSSYLDIKSYIERDPAYCAQCHVTRDQYVVWDQDAHHRVPCQKCHQQTVQEAVTMMQAYVEGGRASKTGKTQMPHSAWVEDQTCLRCHGPQGSSRVSMADSPGHKLHLELPKVTCLSCHARGIHRHSEPGSSCQKCHDERSKSGCANDGQCSACHTFVGQDSSLLPSRHTCEGCHQLYRVGKSDHAGDPHAGSLDCSVCHRPHVPSGPKVVSCTSCHTGMERRGFHASAGHSDCRDCHKPHSWDASKVDCGDCHDGDHVEKAKGDCRSCHSVRTEGRKR